jgi:hypothetical protein
LFDERKENLEMNGRRLILMVLLAVAVILLAAGPAAAKATRTEFTATEIYKGIDLDPGVDWTTGKDHEKIWHLRGNIMELTVDASDDRVDGYEIVTCNLDMKLVDDPVVWATGRMWGTFKITNDDGTWEGTWTGVRDERGYSFFKYLGKGGGDYAGLQIRVDSERLDPDPTYPYSWTGYLLDPHGE